MGDKQERGGDLNQSHGRKKGMTIGWMCSRKICDLVLDMVLARYGVKNKVDKQSVR